MAEILKLAIPVTFGQQVQFLSSEYADSIRSRYRGRRLITDDNMGNGNDGPNAGHAHRFTQVGRPVLAARVISG